VWAQTMEALFVALENSDVENRGIHFAYGLPIPQGHEKAVEKALASGADLICLTEDDNVWPADGIKRAVQHMERTNADLVAVNYPIGLYPPRWSTVCRYEGEILFTGLGLTIVKREVFDKLPRPWFRLDRRMALVTKNGKRQPGLINRPYRDGEGGVDVVFGLRLREMGFRQEEVPDLVGGHIRPKQLGKYNSNNSPHSYDYWNTIDSEQKLFRNQLTDRGRWGETPDSKQIERQVRRLGKWVTGFELAGKHYGGSYDAINDPRIKLLKKQMRPPKRVLELGALEGGHTVALAQWAEEVVGVEGRKDNIRRARYLVSLFEANAQLVHANLETYDLKQLGTFDLAYCVGLLYHLPDPKGFLKQIPQVAPRLFLWTHVSENGQPKTYQEHGIKDPLSGLSPTSTWLPRDELLDTLKEMYRTVKVLKHERNHKDSGPAITVYAEGVS
jgi:SAM-dependent methyltransferase